MKTCHLCEWRAVTPGEILCAPCRDERRRYAEQLIACRCRPQPMELHPCPHDEKSLCEECGEPSMEVRLGYVTICYGCMREARERGRAEQRLAGGES
jgi:hypothetical protein